MYLTQSYLNEHTEVKEEINRFSQLLHNTISPSKLFEFSWIMYNFDKQHSNSSYIFREKDNGLLAITDGQVKKGSWEILSLTNSILISDGQVDMLYNIVFFCNEGIILQKENIQEYLILIKRTNKQLQTKTLKEIFAVFLASYEKEQRRFDNIDLDAVNSGIEFEDVTEFKEYGFFPYVSIIGAVVLVIAIVVFVVMNL